MAQNDWAALTGGALGTGVVARGVSAAFTKPTGGGGFCFGFRSLATTAGFAGYYLNLANFNPVAGTRKGGSIRAAMKRYSSGASYCPIMGFMVGTDPTVSKAYMMGLTAATSYQIGVKKGMPVSGIAASDSMTFRKSTTAWTTVGDALAGWFHLRLDVLVNPHGEVILNCYQNTGNVTAPTWVAITGMTQYIEDPMGIMSGDVAGTLQDGFYAFLGHYTADSSTVSLWDHIEVHRQTAP